MPFHLPVPCFLSGMKDGWSHSSSLVTMRMGASARADGPERQAKPGSLIPWCVRFTLELCFKAKEKPPIGCSHFELGFCFRSGYNTEACEGN